MLYCTLDITLSSNFDDFFKKNLFYLVCSFLYPINPQHFIDHGSIIKHIIQEPLEIF